MKYADIVHMHAGPILCANLLLRTLWQVLLLASTRVARALILDLLLLLLNDRWRVSLLGDLLPFSGGIVGYLDGCHQVDEGFSDGGFE